MEKGKTARCLLLCLSLAAGLCLAQVRSSTGMILLVLGLFLLLMVVGAFRDFVCPVLLFFLPWSTVMKLSPGSVSFFSLGLALTVCVWAMRFGFRLNGKCVTAAVLLAGLTLLAKLLTGGSLSADYLLFLLLLALFPRAVEEPGTFQRLTVFFAVGIISAALSARALVSSPGLARYIDVDAWEGVVRYSGYYGDANFYAAHISAVLGGVFLLLLREENRQKCLGWLALAGMLMFCGLMSASKTFVITLGLMLCLWSLAAWKRRRFGLLLGLASAAVALLCCGAAAEAVEVLVYRFSFSSDLSALTTGRTELWGNYLREILDSPRLLLFGTGYTDVKVLGRASHSTPIQLVYQFGMTGCALMLGWMAGFLSGQLRRWKGMEPGILALGIFLPWFALDLVFFDEFFLMPMYLAAGLKPASGQGTQHERGESPMDHTEHGEITLTELWKVFTRNILTILLAAVLCGAGCAAYASWLHRPEYSSTATLYILRQSEEASDSSSANDFSLALKLVGDCSYLIKSHTVLDGVIRELGLDMTYEELYARVSTANPTDTRILEVAVTMDSPEKAKAAADAICRLSLEFVAEALGTEQLNLLEYGTLEPEPSNSIGPAVWILAGVGGGFLAWGVCLVRFLPGRDSRRRRRRRTGSLRPEQRENREERSV